MTNKMQIVSEAPAEPVSITKPPEKFNLDQFKSKRSPLIAGVETLQTALPHYRLSDANDFARLHPNEENSWSAEFCFVIVPIKGMKDGALHLIDETLAMANLPSKKIQRFRLALATKPYDVFFLCHVPSQNLDNEWNKTNLQGCEQAKQFWTQLTSRKAEGIEGYQISFSKSQQAFPEPKWPNQSLDALIEVTFNNRMICDKDDPGLKRLLGDVQLP